MRGKEKIILARDHLGSEFFKFNSGVNCACDCQVRLPYHVGDQETKEKDS